MIFSCENCHHKLVNEFCPKCGQRMIVACDECTGRIAKIEELESVIIDRDWQLREAVGKAGAAAKTHTAEFHKIEDAHAIALRKLRQEYDSTVESQRDELQKLRAESSATKKRHQDWERDAWQKVAEALDLPWEPGFVIDERSVLRRLKIERNAASILRSQVQDLKSENAGQIAEFARVREDFMAKMEERNGALKIEAPQSEV